MTAYRKIVLAKNEEKGRRKYKSASSHHLTLNLFPEILQPSGYVFASRLRWWKKQKEKTMEDIN